MKKIFVIDRALVFLFVAASFSGIGLHAAGHGGCHAQWHNWAVGHVAASLLFFVFAVLHVKTHWGWYKARIKNGVARKE
ncbi:MAG: DUF4405 domain-containing protein, partial [Rikenellaceae bacterium]|nr:DUF4405 domain-containing protein [Rikenellaceae bacterium]